MHTLTKPQVLIRALAREDLDAVVAIDASIAGRSRRTYIERRLAAALRQPGLHVQLAAVDGKGLAGVILARRMVGDFGQVEPGLRVEIVGVRTDRQRRGIGRRLLEALSDHAGRHGLAELRTIAAWNDHAMLRWLDATGFGLAPELVLECAIGKGYQAERSDGLDLGTPPSVRREVDYGAPESNDNERIERTRCDVRAMRPQDLPQILRIDRGLTGRDRAASIEDKLREAMEDSGIRVSLTARMDGAIVGFAMARADLGDFGRVEPVSVLDTIGVDPAYARRGVGHALVSQLFSNCGALHIDRLETAVRLAELPLIGFLRSVGFERSQRLPFARAVPARG
jgi:ribosomal protein S18 acetylase RimI-like enzyme